MERTILSWKEPFEVRKNRLKLERPNSVGKILLNLKLERPFAVGKTHCSWKDIDVLGKTNGSWKDPPRCRVKGALRKIFFGCFCKNSV